MGRIVKIWDMGTKGDMNDAYKAPNGRYYSSKAAYEEIVKNSENRKKCIDFMMEILGYESQMKPNTYIFKLLKELEPFGYDVIYETMMKVSKDIAWALNTKQFINETAEIKYIFAIINNNVMDIYKEKQHMQELFKQQAKVIEFKAAQHSDEDYDIGSHKRKGHDVSGLLGDSE